MEESKSQNQKNKLPIMNLVVIGNVDSGKSTTCGHLLYNLGGIGKREIDALQKEAEQKKKASFGLAYVMDNTQAEKDRGITINISMKKFRTKNFNYNLIDAPGHKDFVKNMITGTQQADIGMLMVSAHKGEFESGFAKDGQTKEHALLAYTLGVKRMIICVNKMDQESVKFSEERYNEVKNEVENYLRKKIGFKEVSALPISGFKGDNLIKKSENMHWYKGPSLVDLLDSQKPAPRPYDKPLRVPVQNVYQIAGVGTVVAGKVESGVIKPGMQVQIWPSGKVTKVLQIEAHKEQLQSAGCGDSIGLNLKNITFKDIFKGMVISEVGSNACKPTKEFIAQVMIMNHPKEIKQGYSPSISIHSAQFTAAFDEIITKIDRKTGKMIENSQQEEASEDEKQIYKNGEAVLVRMKTDKEVAVECFAEYPALGRFVIRDQKKTVAIGIIKKLGHDM